MTESSVGMSDLRGIEYKYLVTDKRAENCRIYEHGDNRFLHFSRLEKKSSHGRYDCIMMPLDGNDDKKGLTAWLIHRVKNFANIFSAIHSTRETFKTYVSKGFLPNLYELDDYLNDETTPAEKFNCITMVDYIAIVCQGFHENYRSKFTPEEMKYVIVFQIRSKTQLVGSFIYIFQRNFSKSLQSSSI